MHHIYDIDNYRILSLSAYCAAVGFGAVESANVVGYLEKAAATQGYTLFTPTFADVGVDGMDIQKIKLVGSSGDLSDFIQTFTAAGALNPEYSYLTMDGFGMAYVWYDSNFEPVEETVQPGAAFLIWNSVGEGMKLQLPSAY